MHPSKGQTSFVVSAANDFGSSFILKTAHISSRTSHPYLGIDRKYNGIVIFACNDKQATKLTANVGSVDLHYRMVNAVKLVIIIIATFKTKSDRRWSNFRF